MPPSVSSENTTPKPNVSSAAFRSQTVISWPGSSCLASAAKYRPPGPPPTTAIRTRLPLPRTVPKLRCRARQVNAGFARAGATLRPGYWEFGECLVTV